MATDGNPDPEHESTAGSGLRFPTHASPTPRETQILAQILRGLNQIEIAAEEGIALSTVRMHVRNLHQKARTRNLHSLAVWAIEHEQCCVRPDSA